MPICLLEPRKKGIGAVYVKLKNFYRQTPVSRQQSAKNCSRLDRSCIGAKQQTAVVVFELVD